MIDRNDQMIWLQGTSHLVISLVQNLTSQAVFGEKSLSHWIFFRKPVD